MTNQETLGTIGEIYYQALFGGFLSYDKYDSKKDLVQADEVLTKGCTKDKSTQRKHV